MFYYYCTMKAERDTTAVAAPPPPRRNDQVICPLSLLVGLGLCGSGRERLLILHMMSTTSFAEKKLSGARSAQKGGKNARKLWYTSNKVT